MQEYQKPYTILWHGITNAIKAIDEQNQNFAKSILEKAQFDAEEAFLSFTPEDADDK